LSTTEEEQEEDSEDDNDAEGPASKKEAVDVDPDNENDNDDDEDGVDRSVKVTRSKLGRTLRTRSASNSSNSKGRYPKRWRSSRTKTKSSHPGDDDVEDHNNDEEEEEEFRRHMRKKKAPRKKSAASWNVISSSFSERERAKENPPTPPVPRGAEKEEEQDPDKNEEDKECWLCKATFKTVPELVTHLNLNCARSLVGFYHLPGKFCKGCHYTFVKYSNSEFMDYVHMDYVQHQAAADPEEALAKTTTTTRATATGGTSEK